MKLKLPCNGLYFSIRGILIPIIMTGVQYLGVAQSMKLASCGFENQTAQLCGWSIPPWAEQQGGWVRSGGSPSPFTGPQLPQADVGGGWFLVLNSTHFKDSSGFAIAGKKVGLLTPELSGVHCVAFLFMKYTSEAVIGDLSVGVYKGGSNDVILWNNTAKTDRTWQCQMVDVPQEHQSPNEFYVEATSSSFNGDIAVDEISLFDFTCPPQENCLAVLDGSFSSGSTTSPTASSEIATSSATATSPPSRSTAVTYTTSSTTASAAITEKPAEQVDTVILLTVIIPVVVLIAAAVVAVVCYRRRSSANPDVPLEEPYDVIPDNAVTKNLPPRVAEPNPEVDYTYIADEDVVTDPRKNKPFGFI